MTSTEELHQLYQEIILDHNKHPKNFKKIENPTIEVEGYNPLCGDHYRVYLKLDENQLITDISFEGQGCAISKASASMMTSAVKGKKIEEALSLQDEFHQLLTKKLEPDADENHLGKLNIFSGVWKYPARVKCASLSWHTLKNALKGKNEVAKTE